MTGQKLRLDNLTYWGLVLTVCAPVFILGVFLILLLTFPGASLSSGRLSVLLITKAVFYGGGIILILGGNFLQRNYPAVLLAILALIALFFQLLPPQISPSGMDVVLGLPGLTLIFVTLLIWLPDLQEKNSYLRLAFSILLGLLTAYQLFEILALTFVPYALPSFLHSQAVLKWLETLGKWLVYFSLIFKLYRGIKKQEGTILYYKTLLGITALTMIFAMLFVTNFFIQLQKSSAVIEYVLEPQSELMNMELLLPVPQFNNGDDVLTVTDFKVYKAKDLEPLDCDLQITRTDYGKCLRFNYDKPIRDKIIIRGQVEAHDLGWYLGRDEIPVTLSPRILDEHWTQTSEAPIIPEHNAIYTAVYCGNGMKSLNLSYCLELVVKGVKKSAYQQVFTAYLPFNYMEGFQLKEGWQLVPMIEEIVVREMN